MLDGADADYETLSRVPLTRAVITEALRLVPRELPITVTHR